MLIAFNNFDIFFQHELLKMRNSFCMLLRIHTQIPHIIFKISNVCFLLLGIVIADIDILYRKDVCDESEFYKPYVRLLRTRQPHHENFPILKLQSPGYLSVARHSAILCINGPAIVYTDTNQLRCSGKGSAEWVPSSGEPQLFVHDCFSINRFPREQYKQNLQDLEKDTEVFGNKVFGVYLLGAFPDYKLASFHFFPRPDFGLRQDSSWCVNEGGSVAFVANSSDSGVYCYRVAKYNTEGVINFNYNGNPMFCFRADQEDEFDAVWRKEKPLYFEDIIWRSGEALCNPNIQSFKTSDYETEPFQLPDFRIVDPKFWSSQGSTGVIVKKKKSQGDLDDVSIYSKPNPPGSLFPGEPGWSDSSQWTAGEGTVESTTAEPPQKFQVDMTESDCEEMPKVPELEACTDKINEPCDILHQVLTLEEVDWKSENMNDGSWRLTILNQVSSIFEKVCPQVPKFLSSTLSKLFQYFLSNALKEDSTLKEKFNGNQHQDWNELTAVLERCYEKADMMTFFKKNDNAAIKLKKHLESKLDKLYKAMSQKREATMKHRKPEGSTSSSETTDFPNLEKTSDHAADIAEIEKVKSHLEELPIKFPFSILVGTAGTPGYAGATKIYQYREAAELDHELDWALDTFWKVITTVMGYCYSHFTTKDAAAFDKMYQGFSKDFMAYIQKDWINGDNIAIYEQLFGEFIYGQGFLWLDACQNGAYQWSDIVDLRPLRPLHVHEGDAPPLHVLDPSSEGSTKPENFYLTNPTFVDNDHADYYDEKGSDLNTITDDGPPEEVKVSDSLRRHEDDRRISIAEAVMNLPMENNGDDVAATM